MKLSKTEYAIREARAQELRDNPQMYFDNENDAGAAGRQFEVDFRNEFFGVLERVHPLGVADIAVKAGVTIECKSGCGWLVNPEFATPAEAWNYFMSTNKPMLKASHVAYIPSYDGYNLDEARILTQKQFIEIFRNAGKGKRGYTQKEFGEGKLRVKKSSKGLYGIAIQSYISTPSFKASKDTYNEIVNGLNRVGMTAEEFIEKMGL